MHSSPKRTATLSKQQHHNQLTVSASPLSEENKTCLMADLMLPLSTNVSATIQPPATIFVRGKLLNGLASQDITRGASSVALQNPTKGKVSHDAWPVSRAELRTYPSTPLPYFHSPWQRTVALNGNDVFAFVLRVEDLIEGHAPVSIICLSHFVLRPLSICAAWPMENTGFCYGFSATATGWKCTASPITEPTKLESPTATPFQPFGKDPFPSTKDCC